MMCSDQIVHLRKMDACLALQNDILTITTELKSIGYVMIVALFLMT